jgi:hypothetical protein
MAENLKVLRVNIVIWWVFFIILFLLTIALMIGTLATTKWVELNLTTATAGPYSIFAFKGSIMHVEDGMSYLKSPIIQGYVNNFLGSNYETVACSRCSAQQVLNYNNVTGSTTDFITAWCTMFKSLWLGAGFFIAFEILAMICASILIFLLILYIYRIYYLNLTLCLGTTLFFAHYIGTSVWLGLNNYTFDGDCSALNSGTKPPVLCLKDGPKLGVFVLVLTPCIIIPFFFIICYIKKHHLVPETHFLAHAHKDDIEFKSENIKNTNVVAAYPDSQSY